MNSIPKHSLQRRRSAKRDAILKLMRSERLDHPTANDVYLAIRKTYPNISLGTVYRNLNEMSGDGSILKISSPHAPDRFDHTIEPHLHFVCSHCGRICDLHFNSLFFSMKKALESEGFEIENFSITITGACPNCTSQLSRKEKNEHTKRH